MPAADVTVASIGPVDITRQELDSALYKSHGLKILFDVVELELAKSTLQHAGQTLQPTDIQRERQLVLQKLCGDADPSDYEKLLDQYLQQQHLSRAEFDNVIQINACLRKIVEPRTIGSLSDADVKRGFDQIYGQKRQIADIQVDSLKDAAMVKHRLGDGEKFDDLARKISTDNVTAPQGGKWQAFSSASPPNVVPAPIKEAAFALKIGEVSDPIQANDHYHIIKLLDVMEPKLIKFDDVKTEVRKQLEDQLVEYKMKLLRRELTQAAQQIQITDPILHEQWQALLDQNRPKSTPREKVLNQITKENHPPATKPGGK
jgi:foldase protein PrsA